MNILLDNAVKYCDDGGLIHIDYSRFFERFYRGDTSHNSAKAGYGIGLSMAEDLTKLLKGRISVRWDQGVITFQVELG